MSPCPLPVLRSRFIVVWAGRGPEGRETQDAGTWGPEEIARAGPTVFSERTRIGRVPDPTRVVVPSRGRSGDLTYDKKVPTFEDSGLVGVVHGPVHSLLYRPPLPYLVEDP